MFIYRLSSYVIYCALLASYIFAAQSDKDLKLTVCFDNQCSLDLQKTFLINGQDSLGREPVIFFQKLTSREKRVLSLPAAAREQYSCFQSRLDRSKLKKNHGLVFAQSSPQNRAIFTHEAPLPPGTFDLQYANIFSTQDQFTTHPTHERWWNYQRLASLSMKKISAQKYALQWEHFRHPHHNLDFQIKVNLHKWAVVDNKYGSALIRLD